MLSCGLNCSEFLDIARRVYVRVASEQYGIRGRPTNLSRVSAMTGLSRRAVRRLRGQNTESTWSPDDSAGPFNTVVHYWRFDPRFCDEMGVPRVLGVEGVNSFADLAKTYVSGIPPISLSKEMLRLGIIAKDETGGLRLEKAYVFPNALDADFLRNWAFSLSSHGSTLIHNAKLMSSGQVSEQEHILEGRFEQIAWSRRLSESQMHELQSWARTFGHDFVQAADLKIARLESDSGIRRPGTETSGVGVFYFRSGN